jgi:hypothetical protein
VNRAFVRASALTSLVLAVGCMQDFDQFRGGGGAGTGGMGGSGGGVVDPCEGVDCDDDNPCTQDSCVDGTCQNVPGTATFPDEADDCVDTVCEDGVQTTVPDDTETPPSDGLECTTDTCSAGAAVYTATPGQPCGNGSVCNAAGQCSCNVPGDCGTNPDCGTWACETTGCVLNLVPSDTTTPVEDNGTVGDCLALFCDDDPDGNLVELPSADLPVDGDQCTLDVCTNGTPSNPNSPNGTACTMEGNTACPGCQCTAGACCTTQAQACGARECGMVPDSCGNMETCGTCMAPEPACTAAGQCVECTADGNCAAPEGKCALSGANLNTCVECLDTPDCASNAAEPICKLTAPGLNTCVQCLDSDDCNGVAGKPICNTTTNLCVACNDSDDCTGTPATPVCSPSGTCVQCVTSGQCDAGSTTPVCNTTTNTCVGCTSNTQCTSTPPGPICNMTTGACGCTMNNQCGGGGKQCLGTGVCEP